MAQPNSQSLTARIKALEAEIAGKHRQIRDTEENARRTIAAARAECERIVADARKREHEAERRAALADARNDDLLEELSHRDQDLARVEGYLQRVHERDDIESPATRDGVAVSDLVRKPLVQPHRPRTIYDRRFAAAREAREPEADVRRASGNGAAGDRAP